MREIYIHTSERTMNHKVCMAGVYSILTRGDAASSPGGEVFHSMATTSMTYCLIDVVIYITTKFFDICSYLHNYYI
jgi:hypothetical protein